MNLSSPHSYICFLSHNTASFYTDDGAPLIMTGHILPAENGSLVSRSSTSHEAEDPASRLVSVVTRSPAVSADPFAYQTANAFLPTYHQVTDCGDVHDTDGNAAGTRASQPLEPTDSDQTPSQECTDKHQSRAQIKRDTILRSWWREMIATIFSITSMALVLVLVLKINNTALGSWNFHVGSLAIQPNTLISVLTTIGQTLMMVPVTACIGQLKWRYFRRARHLHHMQLMDDASRGPWGSLLLLSRLASTKAATASLLALVTIVALGIGPARNTSWNSDLREYCSRTPQRRLGWHLTTPRNRTCLIMAAEVGELITRQPIIQTFSSFSRALSMASRALYLSPTSTVRETRAPGRITLALGFAALTLILQTELSPCARETAFNLIAHMKCRVR